MNGWTDGEKNGQTDKQMDKQTDRNGWMTDTVRQTGKRGTDR